MPGDDEIIYIGCFGGDAGTGQGVAVAHRDPASGRLTGLRLAAPAPSPSFLASHPTKPVVYAACDPGGGQHGLLSAWSVQPGGPSSGGPSSGGPSSGGPSSGGPGPGGGLRPLGGSGTGGEEPCHVALHRSGRFAFTANYGGGSVSVHRLDPRGAPAQRTDLIMHDGSGPDRQRQERPHPHMVAVDPDGDAVHVVDLGADAVFHYRLDPGSGRLHRTGVTTTRSGSGPRHIAGTGQWRYLVGELDGTLTSYRVAGNQWEQHDRVPICADGVAGFASEVGGLGRRPVRLRGRSRPGPDRRVRRGGRPPAPGGRGS